ncbi:membrane dipeptidase [Streptomyces xantholiticus]|uniref:membrane dipeptidase n=1 Tax=Streptomyces xantholiticus TaxID=68285 RepID=UPI001674E1E4|nr:membrane dipeptidase [Streptomyces xantholiticus]GGW66931.1 dipeptidase [Streptomyces xantholiticus]
MADPQNASPVTTVDLGDLDDLDDDLDALAAAATEPPPDPELAAAATEPPPDPEPAAPAIPPVEPLARAKELLRSHPLIDGYNGLAPVLRSMHWYDLEAGESLLETDVPRLRRGGIGAQFWSLQETADRADAPSLGATLELIDLVRATVAVCPEGLRLALSADDVVDTRNCGRISVLLGPMAGPALGDSLAALRAMYTLGVRSVSLAGSRWTRNSGLTPFGHEMVREMNRLGVLVDLSGCSPDTMRRTFGVTRAPVLLSHQVEPLPDDVLRGLRTNNGVCMVMCTPGTLAETADRLDRIREIAGPGSVALSGAHDTGAAHAAGLQDVSCMPRMIAELLERGWPESDITNLTWSNVARVLRGTEFAARAARPRRAPSRVTIGALDL